MPIQSGIIIAWVGTNASIPSGWTRETSLDARFAKSAPASTDPGTTGGSATHDHPFPSSHTHTGASHTHVSGDTALGGVASGSQLCYNLVDQGMAATSHLHTTTVSAASSATSAGGGPSNFDTTSSDPPYLEVIFIKSDGSPAGLPNNGVGFFNSGAPSGWGVYSTGANRFWKGAAGGGNAGGTGGASDAHSHTSATHTHSSGGTHLHAMAADAGTSGTTSGPCGSSSLTTTPHTHTIADTGTGAPTFATTAASTTTNGDGQPPWSKVLPIQNTSGADSNPIGVIAIWTGTVASIPSGWKLCDGTSSTPDLRSKFVKGSASSGENGTTGGASTHTHATGAQHTHVVAAHSHTRAANTDGHTGVNNNCTEDSMGQPCLGHSHSLGGSTSTDGSATSGATDAAATANSDNKPVYTEVLYIQLANAFFSQTLSVTGTGTATMVRLPGRALYVTATGTATFKKVISLTKSVTATGTASMSRFIRTAGGGTLLVNAFVTATLAKKPIKVFALTATGTPSLSIQIGIPQDMYAVSLTQFIKAVSTTNFIEGRQL